MAINLITGKTGSGKSYFAVLKILELLDQNKFIFTNISININSPYYRYVPDTEFKLAIQNYVRVLQEAPSQEAAKQLLKNHYMSNSVLIIDEAHLMGFRKNDENIADWLSLHRHLGQDIYLITQTPKNIYRNYQDLVHTHVLALPPKKRLSKNSLFYRIYDGLNEKDFTTHIIKADPDIFSLYKSGKKELGFNIQLLKLIVIIVALFALGLFAKYMFSRSVTTITDNNLTVSDDVNISNNLKKAAPGSGRSLQDNNNSLEYCTIKSKIISKAIPKPKSWILIEPVDRFTDRIFYKKCITK